MINLGKTQPSFYAIFNYIRINKFWNWILTVIIGIIVFIAARWMWEKTDCLALQGAALVLAIFLVMPYYHNTINDIEYTFYTFNV